MISILYYIIYFGRPGYSTQIDSQTLFKQCTMTNSTANIMATMSSIVMTSAASSDTMSEISDSGTGTSGRSYSDSREEMHQLATSLGLESTDDLAKERFKVDRKKLEAMLHCKYFLIKYLYYIIPLCI